MEGNRVLKRMLYGRPGGRRKKGRPRLRWLDDVEEDLREIGMRRWRTKAVDRNEWQRLLVTVAPRSERVRVSSCSQ
jgi:hypothetical protein